MSKAYLLILAFALTSGHPREANVSPTGLIHTSSTIMYKEAIEISQCKGADKDKSVALLVAAAAKCEGGLNCNNETAAWIAHNLALSSSRMCPLSFELTRILYSRAVELAPSNGRIWLHYSAFESKHGEAQRVS